MCYFCFKFRSVFILLNYFLLNIGSVIFGSGFIVLISFLLNVYFLFLFCILLFLFFFF